MSCKTELSQINHLVILSCLDYICMFFVGGGHRDFRFCGFGHFLDRLFGFCVKRFQFFGFGVQCGLRIFRFLASAFGFS